jgi:hypothetical protein
LSGSVAKNSKPPQQQAGVSEEEDDDDEAADNDEAVPTPKMHKDHPSEAIQETAKTIALGPVLLKLLVQFGPGWRPLQVSPTASAEDLVSNLRRTVEANTIAATVDAVDQGSALVHHRSGPGSGALGFTLIFEFRGPQGRHGD